MKTIQKSVLTIFIFTLLCQPIFCQSWRWASNAGGSSTDEAERVAVDHIGNVYIVGKFSGNFTYGNTNISSNGSKDIFLAKYDSLGNNIWVKTAGGNLNDEGLSVSCDLSGNVAITGHFRLQAYFDSDTVTGANIENFFVAKYSSGGNLLWVNSAIGPGKSIGKGLECDKYGNVLITGYYQDTCVFGNITLVSPGEKNIFLAKYDSTGNLLWVSYGGGEYDAWASSVSTDDYCNSYITGSFKDTSDFGNNTIITTGGNDMFLVKCDSSGNWVWAVKGGGIDNDYGNGIRVDPLNNIAVTGSMFQTGTFAPAPSITSNGSKDGFVAYYNPQGNCLWAKNMGGLQSDKGIDVAGDKDGNIYVTGFVGGIAQFNSITDTAIGGDDIFIAKYDNLGNIKYADLAGGTSHDYGKGIAVSAPGIAYIAGYFQTTAWFSNDTLVSAGDRDIYVTKYYDGSPVFVSQPSSSDVCEGDTVTLTVQLSGPSPFSYLWFDDAGSILGAVNSSYTFIASDTNYSGKYFCMVNNTIASVTSDTALIYVHPLPQLNLGPDISIFYHDSITLDAGAGFVSYYWSTGDTTQSIVIQGTQIGLMIDISVSVIDINGCSNSDTINIVIIVNGVEQNNNKDLICIIYPNPAKHIVNVKMNTKIEYLHVINLLGQVILEKKVDNNEMKLNILYFEPGLFFLKIKIKNGIVTRKIIIY